MKPRPPGTSSAMSMSSANSTISTVKGHKDLNFLPAVADAASQEKLFRNVSNALQPLKPKILPNDLLEYEYSQYLDEELLASLLEEDEETTKNVSRYGSRIPRLKLRLIIKNRISFVFIFVADFGRRGGRIGNPIILPRT